MTQYKIIGYNFGNVTHETPDLYQYQTIVVYYYVKVGKKTMIWNPNKAVVVVERDKELKELPPGYVKKIIKVKKEKKND